MSTFLNQNAIQDGSITLDKLSEEIINNFNSQSDWSENDSSSPSYVKNRTHYCYSKLNLGPVSLNGKDNGDILYTGLNTSGIYRAHNYNGNVSINFEFEIGLELDLGGFFGPPIKAICDVDLTTNEYYLKLSSSTYGVNQIMYLTELEVKQLDEVVIPKGIPLNKLDKRVVTAVKINEHEFTPFDNGIVDLGTISGGSSSSGSGAYAEVNHGTSDTTFTLTPNTFHVWDEVASLDLTLGSETSGVANEYLFQFTSGSTLTTLSLPSDIKWAEEFTIEQNKIYQISILKGLGSVLSWELITTLKFTVNQNDTLYEYEYIPGMCWDEWIASEYNIDNYIISGTHVRKNSSYGLYESDNHIKINSTDEIIENYQYRLKYDD